MQTKKYNKQCGTIFQPETKNKLDNSMYLSLNYFYYEAPEGFNLDADRTRITSENVDW